MLGDVCVFMEGVSGVSTLYQVSWLFNTPPPNMIDNDQVLLLAPKNKNFSKTAPPPR